jgi:hypothetical protein
VRSLRGVYPNLYTIKAETTIALEYSFGIPQHHGLQSLDVHQLEFFTTNPDFDPLANVLNFKLKTTTAIREAAKSLRSLSSISAPVGSPTSVAVCIERLEYRQELNIPVFDVTGQTRRSVSRCRKDQCLALSPLSSPNAQEQYILNGCI